ncbi:histone-lysine N-methyltransferase SETMAR [Plakobranchus ocellatus]|uniref:Histone-lysine N-methyltransferase SETMAR n=1 Tax=Plakobranchus ocellatus TaxID=259542 RepID=A0AAV4DS50_9GAST|nr:histone-lysine N-methyltransferase SETMAR [Plakobranchus ocellatus]
MANCLPMNPKEGELVWPWLYNNRVPLLGSRFKGVNRAARIPIRRKRPGFLRRGVVLQHDNATPHSANLTQQWLQRCGWEILPHPAHSPDLAPLKHHLGGMAFETEDDLISELRNWFDNLDVDFFRVGINSLLSRWQKCIDLHGDYVEK